MMNDALVTMTGNVATTPRQRSTSNGTKVLSFRLANTPRRRDPAGGWVDGETVFLSVSCWRQLSSGVAYSLVTGDPVLVTGRLEKKCYTDKDGQQQESLELEAQSVGPDLSRCTAEVRRNSRRRDEAAGADSGAESIAGDPDAGDAEFAVCDTEPDAAGTVSMKDTGDGDVAAAVRAAAPLIGHSA